MIRSLRKYFIVRLFIAAGISALLVIASILILIQRDFRTHLDIQLETFALTIENIVVSNFEKNHLSDLQKFAKNIQTINPILKSHCIYPHQVKDLANKINLGQIQFQVWDKNGKTLLYSNPKLMQKLFEAPPGFSNKVIDNTLLRILITRDFTSNLTIAVVENYFALHSIQMETILHMIITMLIVFPILGIVIWLVINKGLFSISQIIVEVQKMAINYLQPINIKDIPNEIQPLIHELNKIFLKLETTLAREKRFAADAAHELKTPLAALKTQAQVAISSVNSDEKQKALENVIKCVDRGTHTVQQLLTLSRILPDSINKKTEPVNLEKEAVKLIAELYPLARSKNIELELIPSHDHPIIMGHTIEMDIMLRNLIDNAIRYTQKGGNIQIIIENQEKYLIIKVIDDGPGIPIEFRGRVFERFFRVVGTESPGSGLGLSIVKQIVNLYKADIDLLTPKSGKGLEVKITFKKGD